MEQRIRELVDKLNEYSKAYYVLDAPKISYKEYDELYDELLRLEEQSGIILPDSPTQRVGGDPLPCLSPILTYTGYGALTRCAPGRIL